MTVTGGPLAELWRRIDALKHELAKFGIVGLTAYGIDTVVFLAVRLAFHEPLVAKTIAALIAGTAAFAGNRYWTWRHRPSSGLGREYVRYGIVNGIGLTVQLGCLGLSHYGLGWLWPEVFQTVLADLVSGSLIGQAVATTFRFWAYRTLVFRAEEPRPTEPSPGREFSTAGRCEPMADPAER